MLRSLVAGNLHLAQSRGNSEFGHHAVDLESGDGPGGGATSRGNPAGKA